MCIYAFWSEERRGASGNLESIQESGKRAMGEGRGTKGVGEI